LVIGVPRVSDWCKGDQSGRYQIQGMLSQKIMLKDAKIDELMSSLGNSIKILNQLQKYCSNS
jgi:hypothetical protein